MSAVLRAYGSNFDVEAFLASCTLPVCAVKHPGEPVRPESQPDGPRHERSGIHVSASDVDFHEFRAQVHEAAAFLRANAEQVRRLVEFPGVEGVTLDFGIARRDVVVQCDYFPAELVRLAGSLGLAIELSQYSIEDEGGGARMATATPNQAKPQGIYLPVASRILRWPLLAPVWALVQFVAISRLRRRAFVDQGQKQHPAIAEVYQLAMAGALTTGLVVPELHRVWLGTLVLALAGYRAWEIGIVALKWVLADRGPVYDYRRSFLMFLLNVYEAAAAYTLLGWSAQSPGDARPLWAALRNLGLAFKLELPAGVREPYATMFAVESGFLVLVVLACVVGGIQRKGMLNGMGGAA